MLVGFFIHEAIHAVAAMLFAEQFSVGWEGGYTGHPYVEFQGASRWESEVIRKAPLCFGIFGAVVLDKMQGAITPEWLFVSGLVIGVAISSPDDLFLASSAESAKE